MKVALVGFGIENKAAYSYFAKKDAHITICDRDTSLDIPAGAESRLGDNYLDNLDEFDVIVRTSGIHPRLITDKNPDSINKITTAINIFFEECKTPIIGVTGTKGKGTTSTLIAKILETSGKKVVLAGNIGTPVLDMLDDVSNCDIVVLELSSFQLIDLRYSPQIAVCLMVVKEHLDWHTSFNEYIDSKSNLFRYQNRDNIAIFNLLNKDSEQISSVSVAKKLAYSTNEKPVLDNQPFAYLEGNSIFCNKTEIMKISEAGLIGRHNLQNICAAIAATWQLVDGDVQMIRTVIKEFKGLPHRIELISELDGVKYYNDSFATGLHATRAAIEAVKEPKVLILGGYDRQLPLEHFSEFVKKNEKEFKNLLIIGSSAERLSKTLESYGFTKFIVGKDLDSMQKIVNKAKELARPGDAVVLSPGFASYDMFKNFEDRGNQFKDCVRKLS